MKYSFEPATPASVAIAGRDERLPVRRIFCVGRNYAEHAREMGTDPDRDPPFFFTKPADAVVDSGRTIPYPPETGNLHYEAELVVALGRDGFRIAESEVPGHVFGYATGIDLTRRDLQLAARETGRPWDWGKAFDRSAPCGALHRIEETGEMTRGRISLTVNGAVRQDADLSQLIWNVREIVSILSRSIHLKAGDLVYTGTPAGVGAIQPGDEVVVRIDRLSDLVIGIGEAE